MRPARTFLSARAGGLTDHKGTLRRVVDHRTSSRRRARWRGLPDEGHEPCGCRAAVAIAEGVRRRPFTQLDEPSRFAACTRVPRLGRVETKRASCAGGSLLRRGVHEVCLLERVSARRSRCTPIGVSREAGHPPLLVVMLAVATRLGARSFGKHRLVVALIGALIVPLLALLGAELGGWRTGVIAGAIAALYPNLWLYDGLLMPEALAGVLIALALLASVRLQRSGRTSYAVGLGVIIGLAALTRGELLLLLPFLALPVCLARRHDKMRARLRLVAVATLTAALVISPWAIYNFTRFQKPVLISTAEETTLGGANCNPVYYGAAIGAWNNSCFTDITSKPIEESVAASEIRTRVEHYVDHHKSRLALVALARVGRTWDVFKPGDNVTLGVLQRRPRFWSWFALAMYAALVPTAIAGAFVLRRRRVPITPLAAMPVLVTVTAVLFWGNPRFRRPAEVAIVVLNRPGFGGGSGVPWVWVESIDWIHAAVVGDGASDGS